MGNKQNEQLVILMEECSEVIKECSKILRFGESYNKLRYELGDLLGIMEWIVRDQGFDPEELVQLAQAKQEKMKAWTKFQEDK